MQVNFSAVTIVDIVKKSPSKVGSWNLFVKMNDSIGLKLCAESWQRDGNYLRQREAAKIGLGPDTYGIVDVNIDGKQFYGYFTEIVNTNLSSYTRNEIKCEATILRKKLKKIFDFEDNHEDNLGIKNGQFICIDFDDFDEEDCYNNEHAYENFSEVLDVRNIQLV